MFLQAHRRKCLLARRVAKCCVRKQASSGT